MGINQEQRNKLWIEFLKVYDVNLSRRDMKKVYSRAASRLNFRGCTPCQVNGTFNEFHFKAEDLSEDDIKTILNSNLNDMPIKKAKKTPTKKATTAVVKKKKAPAKKATTKVKDAVASAPKVKAVVKTTPTNPGLPGGLKFLYIPKKSA